MAYRSQTCRGRSNGRPLMTYSGEAEAANQADYSARVHKTALRPYQCHTCGCWHLSPKPARPTFEACFKCVGRDRSSKIAYPTEGDANEAASRIGAHSAISLRAYECPYGDGWHLTSRR